MKIGKVNWDRTFLQLIKLCERQELIDALDPYYDALSKENKLSSEYSNLYEEAVKKVKHLEDKSSLTEEEYYEWEGAVGWFDTVGEEIGYRSESLATGLIIALWKPVNNLSITSFKGLKARKVSLPKEKFTFFRMGPKVNGQFWAVSLNAASNYVRHADDWRKNFSGYLRNGSGNWEIDIPDNVGKISYVDSKRNLKILENIGMDVDLLISSNDLAYQVAEKLNIVKKNEAEKLYFGWVEEVYNFAKTELKITY